MRSVSRFETMYSVEYTAANDQHNCWNQYVLTSHRWSARLRALELKLTLGNFKKWKVRVREL